MPVSIGTSADRLIAFISNAIGTGGLPPPPSAMEITRPSVRPAARARTSALARASATAACRAVSRPRVGSETVKLTPEIVLAPASTAACRNFPTADGSSRTTVMPFETW